MKISSFIILLIFTGLACKTKIDNTTRLLGVTYYNNKMGSWVIYNVDSIVFSDFSAPLQRIDTFKYQVKELISEKFINASGAETNRIERFKRMKDSLPWVLTNIWTSNLSSKSLEKVEENNRYVKMIFPIAIGQFWNGNQFNSLEQEDFSFRNLKAPISINGIAFNNTVTILQIDSSNNNFIQSRFAQEIYAENIGMVYKQIDTVEIQSNIKSGLYYRQSAIDWSK